MQTRRGLDLLLRKCLRLSRIFPLLHDAHALLTLLRRPVPSQEMQTWLAVVLSEHSGQHYIILLFQSNSAVDVALTNPSQQTRASPRLEAEGMRAAMKCILRMCGLTHSVMRAPEKEAKEQRSQASDDGAVAASQRQHRILSHHIAGCRVTQRLGRNRIMSIGGSGGGQRFKEKTDAQPRVQLLALVLSPAPCATAHRKLHPSNL